MAIVRNLMVRAGADFSGLQKGMKQAQSQINAFGKNVNGAMKKIGAVLATIGVGMGLGSAIEDAIKFEAMMGTLSESLGDSINDFIKWQNTVGASLGYSKLQSADLANTLSLNFKQIATSQQDLMEKTTKMMETAALIANKRGMQMAEVSDRIRSAMNQEADGADELGVNVRVSAIEQSKAYKEMANGTPWSDLNTNMQKAILYHHILQSVSTNLGDTLQNNTAMKMSAFKASLLDVRLALGEAFLPILSIVLPVLTAFMRKIEVALQYVSAFARALFGGGKGSGIKQQTKATQQQTMAIGGLGDATEKAGKQAKKAGKDAKRGVAGFDQVNLLADPSSGADGGGASGGGVSGGGGGLSDVSNEAGQTEGLIDKVKNKAKELAASFKEFFKNSSGWKSLKEGLKGFWDSLVDFWNSPAIKNFRKAFVEDLPDFFNDLMLIAGGAFKTLGGIIDIFNGLLNNDFNKTLEGSEEVVSGLYDVITGTLGLIFPDLGKAMEEFGKKFGEGWQNFKKAAAEHGGGIKGMLVALWEKVKEEASQKFAEMKNKVIEEFENLKTDAKKKAGEMWSGIQEKFGDVYTWFKTNVTDKIKSAFESIKDVLSGSVTKGFAKVVNPMIEGINKMIRSLNKVKNSIPGLGGIGDIPTIPALAKGGITNGPTLALIGDNPGGQEVVSPLDKLQGIVGNAVMAAMKFSQPTGGSNQGGDLILNIDGRQFARIVKPFLEKETKRVGTNIRLQSI